MSDFSIKVRENITAADLPEPLQNLAVIFDIESVRTLIARHPHERIYVPKLASFKTAIKKALAAELEVKKHLDLKKISYDIGCSPDHLRAIVKEIYQDMRGIKD